MMSAPAVQASRQAPPRERILAAASELFYRNGIRAVGVEAIAEAAGTNKMTLYRHFSSKDELVAEYLRRLAAESDTIWQEIEQKHPGKPGAQLDAWVESMAAHIADTNDRGCALANAAIELPEKDHPARPVIETFKKGQRDKLAELCRAAGLANPELVADELFLLLEGARVSTQSVGHGGPGCSFVRMSRAVISNDAK
jgi:AcrR family transcriptional regulator